MFVTKKVSYDRWHLRVLPGVSPVHSFKHDLSMLVKLRRGEVDRLMPMLDELLEELGRSGSETGWIMPKLICKAHAYMRK